jgi:CheY-like chemotaxis protein
MFSGCEFYFTIPTIESSEDLLINNLVPPELVWEEVLRKHTNENGEDDDDTKSRKRFMVVDGNPMIRRFVQVLADRRGYICDPAASGSQCLELSRLKDYAMIIIDFAMNGLYATTELKRNGYSGLIIGLIDPHQGNLSVQQFMDAGADSVIVTPFTAHQLDKLISFMNELRDPDFAGRLQGDRGPLKEFEKDPKLLGSDRLGSDRLASGRLSSGRLGSDRTVSESPERVHAAGDDEMSPGSGSGSGLIKGKPIKMSLSTDGGFIDVSDDTPTHTPTGLRHRPPAMKAEKAESKNKDTKAMEKTR